MPRLGYKLTEEHKRKVSLALTGRKLSEEHKKNVGKAMSRILKGRSIFSRHKPDCKCCYCRNWPIISPLSEAIRKIREYIDWRFAILKRDNFTCQNCGSKKPLEVHHIKPFSVIFREFIQKYSQFSPIEEKEILIRLAASYDEFWDIDNGQTLCVSCHELAKRTS